MATEPVARGRVVSSQVYDGYALERGCVGEDDEDFQAQTQHLTTKVCGGFCALRLVGRFTAETAVNGALGRGC